MVVWPRVWCSCGTFWDSFNTAAGQPAAFFVGNGWKPSRVTNYYLKRKGSNGGERTRNSQVVQFVQGLRVHHPSDRGGRLRALLRHPGGGVQDARGGSGRRIRGPQGPEGSAGRERNQPLSVSEKKAHPDAVGMGSFYLFTRARAFPVSPVPPCPHAATLGTFFSYPLSYPGFRRKGFRPTEMNAGGQLR